MIIGAASLALWLRGRRTSFPGFIPPFHLIQSCNTTFRRDLPSVPPLRHVGILTSPTRDEAIARTPLPMSTISLPCTPTTSDLSPRILLICPWTFFAGSIISFTHPYPRLRTVVRMNSLCKTATGNLWNWDLDSKERFNQSVKSSNWDSPLSSSYIYNQSSPYDVKKTYLISISISL
jgi:hypothetical protein